MGREINPGIGGAGSAVTSAPSVAVDPRKEGWPLYLNLFGSGNNYWTVRVIDHTLNPVGSPWSAALNTTNSRFGGVLNDATFGYSKDGPGLTGQGTTQEFNRTQGGGSALHDDQYPMSTWFNGSAGGMFEGVSIYGQNQTKYSAGPDLITQILPEAIRPRRYFTITNNNFVELFNLNDSARAKNSVDITPYRSDTSVTDGCRGYACYNERTNTLVTIHRSATQGSVNIFKGRADLNLNKETSTPNIKTWFDNASVSGFSSTEFFNGAVNDEQYGRVIIGDNGEIASIEHHATTLRYRLFRDGAFVREITLGTGGFSPGDNTFLYYTRMKSTWDNNWMLATTAGYQEAAEFSTIAISTKNPSRAFTYRNNIDNVYSPLLPHRGSGFLCMRNQNTNSQGEEVCRLGFENDSNPLSGEDPIKIQVGSSAEVQEIAVGQAVSTSFYETDYNHGYHTTSYAFYAPTNWWPRKWEYGNG